MTNVSLRAVKKTDERYFSRWWNDMTLRSLTSGARKKLTVKEIEAYFSALRADVLSRHFMIVVGRKTVGHVSLAHRPRGWYETQIVIGEKDYWNRGVGTAAIMRLLKKADREGMHKIYLEVRPKNARAIAAYEKAGFKCIRTARGKIRSGSRLLKMVISR